MASLDEVLRASFVRSCEDHRCGLEGIIGVVPKGTMDAFLTASLCEVLSR